jgi:ATP-dependent Clp protease ATP-binding subunit ClpC
MGNNFSNNLKDIISLSREEAIRLGNDFIGVEHLVLGIIKNKENNAFKELQSLNVNIDELKKQIEYSYKGMAKEKPASMHSSMPLTKQAEKVIRNTALEAKINNYGSVESEHMLLSILGDKENFISYLIQQERSKSSFK